MIVIQNKHKIKLKELLIFSKTLPSALLKNFEFQEVYCMADRAYSSERERVNTESKQCIHTVLIICFYPVQCTYCIIHNVINVSLLLLKVFAETISFSYISLQII
jgi:hypothetical protein